MAKLLWGKVYLGDVFSGFMREEPDGRVEFVYDGSFIDSGRPAVAHTLPVRPEPHASAGGLHPFFDNLVSEGWLERIQSRLLGRREASRFELFLAFGFDCAGAVSVVDPGASRSFMSSAVSSFSMKRSEADSSPDRFTSGGEAVCLSRARKTASSGSTEKRRAP